MKKSIFWIVGVVSLGFIAFYAFSTKSIASKPSFEKNESHSNAESKTITTQLGVTYLPDSSQVNSANKVIDSTKSIEFAVTESDKPQSPDYGMTSGVALNVNPQVASVTAALKNMQYPERLSALIQPKPFSLESYQKDPDAYLNVV